jgi:hypothetical protein
MGQDWNGILILYSPECVLVQDEWYLEDDTMVGNSDQALTCCRGRQASGITVAPRLVLSNQAPEQCLLEGLHIPGVHLETPATAAHPQLYRDSSKPEVVLLRGCWADLGRRADLRRNCLAPTSRTCSTDVIACHGDTSRSVKQVPFRIRVLPGHPLPLALPRRPNTPLPRPGVT